MVEACRRLLRTFQVLNLPVCVTEQYPKGLGRTVPELLDLLDPGTILEKTSFSSCGCSGLRELLEAVGTSTVLLCGIETHVCVNQSAHDLLGAGYGVHLAVDAVGSRRILDREIALQKMSSSGVVLTTSEMAAFELLRDSKHLRFKEIQALFK